MTKTLSLGCPPRWSSPRRTDRPTYGGKAADIAAAMGTPLMDWQRHVADVALEVDPATGRLAYRQVVLTVPRQSGKTTLMLALVLLRSLGMGPRQKTVYTAQSGTEARQKWQDDWIPDLEKSPFAKTFKKRLTNGHEALLFPKTGSMQRLVATKKSSGHGGSIDLAILDEAFAHPDGRLEQAMSPAMITRPQPQLWIVSTAGTPEESQYLWSKVEAGRLTAEVATTSAYFEWSAPDEMDPEDPATWYACMPALGITQPEEALRAELDKMKGEGKLNEFERAFLNRWKTGKTDPVIPLERWAACLDGGEQMLDPVFYAFDVTPDRARGAIGACGPGGLGLPVVDAVDCRAGVDWMPSRLLELRDRHHPVAIVCDPKGPAGALLPELAALGVEVKLVDGSQHAQACGMFYDRTMEGKMRHPDQPELVSALDGATKRPLGDAWAWNRRASSVDISPLVAVTLAHWAWATTKPKKRAALVSL